MNRLVTVCLAGLALLTVLGACAAPSAPAATATTAATPAPVSGPPQPGEWTARAESGGFAFTVDAGGEAIVDATYEFASMICTDIFLNGRARTKAGARWAIQDGTFTIEDSFTIPMEGGATTAIHLLIRGEFSQTGRRATGTWEVDSDLLPCEAGEWRAEPDVAAEPTPTS